MCGHVSSSVQWMVLTPFETDRRCRICTVRLRTPLWPATRSSSCVLVDRWLRCYGWLCECWISSVGFVGDWLLWMMCCLSSWRARAPAVAPGGLLPVNSHRNRHTTSFTTRTAKHWPTIRCADSLRNRGVRRHHLHHQHHRRLDTAVAVRRPGNAGPAPCSQGVRCDTLF